MSLISRNVAKTRVALALYALRRVQVISIDGSTCEATVDSSQPFRETKTLGDHDVSDAALKQFREALARWCPDIQDFVRNAAEFPQGPENTIRQVIDVINAKLLADSGPLVCGSENWEQRTEEIRNDLAG